MRDCSKFFRKTRILVGVTLAVVLFGFGAPAANAEGATPETVTGAIPPVHPQERASKTKSAKSSYKPYFVEFRARSAATYGHMYVLYGRVNGRGEIVKSDIAGLHPAGDANDCENCSVVPWTLGHILFVPSETGASDGDLEEKYVSARYRVMVDAATFRKVSAYISKLKADTPMWNALLRNCVSFGNNIAENLGLKTPAFIWMEPKDYVERLRELNGGKPQRPLKFAAPSSAKTSMSAPNSGTAASLPIPRKPKKQPVAKLQSSEAAGVTSDAPR